MPEKLPVPALFINEDISKPENRTNLALLGLMLIPGVRTWLLKRLSLPVDSIVYPPQNVSGGRPDYVVVGPDETVVAWIEVELGGENQAQLAQYRARLAEPVKSIVGPKEATGDLSLEEIAEAVGGPLVDFLDRQQATNVGIFTALVAALAGKTTSFDYVNPTDQLRVRPLVRELAERLGDLLQFGIPPVAPGTAQVSTITQKGWTLRVYSKAASMGTVSLLWDQASSRNEIRVPSRARLDRCFPTAPAQVNQYAVLCKDLGADISTLGEAQSLAIPEAKVLAELDRLIPCIRALATAYGGGTASP